MQTVYLNGGLSKFGARWETSCNTIPEIFKLIDCQTEGFRNYLIQSVEAGIDYQIKRGKDFIDEKELFLSLNEEDIIITEVPAGSGKAGKIIAGIALIIVAFTIGDPTLAIEGLTITGLGFNAATAVLLVGTSLAMQGLSELMMPGPEVDMGGGKENKAYLFSGPSNNLSQGQPVPLLYGDLIIGGAPIGLAFSNSPINLSYEGGSVDFEAGTRANPQPVTNTNTHTSTTPTYDNNDNYQPYMDDTTNLVEIA